MESRNPVLNRMEQEAKANGGYAGFGAATATQAPPVGADTPPAMPIEMTPAGPTMTLNDVIVRTATMFVPLLITAYFAWTLEVGFGIVLIAMFVALGLGFWGALSKKVRPAVFLAYATVEGIVLGGISLYLQDYVNQSQWAAGQANPPNIVLQAVIGTLAAFAAMLFLYGTRIIKVTGRFKKMMAMAFIAYIGIALVSLVAAFLGVGDGWGFYGVGRDRHPALRRRGGAGFLLARSRLRRDRDRNQDGRCPSVSRGARPLVSLSRSCGSTSRSCACWRSSTEARHTTSAPQRGRRTVQTVGGLFVCGPGSAAATSRVERPGLCRTRERQLWRSCAGSHARPAANGRAPRSESAKGRPAPPGTTRRSVFRLPGAAVRPSSRGSLRSGAEMTWQLPVLEESVALPCPSAARAARPERSRDNVPRWPRPTMTERRSTASAIDSVLPPKRDWSALTSVWAGRRRLRSCIGSPSGRPRVRAGAAKCHSSTPWPAVTSWR